MPNIDPETPPGRGEKTRRKIAMAAVELVAELGWDAVTTRAVATRAGVNPALVHYHFGSMDALLRGAVVSAMDQEIGPAAQPFIEASSLAAGIAAAMEAVGAFDPETPAANLLMEAMVRAMRDPELARVLGNSLREYRGLIADRVRTAVASGESPAGLSPEGTGVLVAAALDGVLLHRVIDPSTDVEGFRDVLLRLVTSPSQRSDVTDPRDPAQGGTQ